MNWLQFKTMYISTLQREVRSKSFISVFVITLVLIAIFCFSYNYFVNDILDAKAGSAIANHTITVMFTLVGWWGFFLAAHFGAGCIKSDTEDNVTVQLLSFPIKRIEYLLARALGALSIVFSYYILSFLIVIVAIYFISGQWYHLDRLYIVFPTSLLSLWGVVLLGLFLSLYLNRNIAFLAVMVLNILIAISDSFFSNADLSALFKDFGALEIIALFFYWAFPRVSTWSNVASSARIGSELPEGLGWELAHYAVIISLWVWLISYLFRRKDI